MFLPVVSLINTSENVLLKLENLWLISMFDLGWVTYSTLNRTFVSLSIFVSKRVVHY